MFFNAFLLNRPSAFPYNSFALFCGGYTPPGSYVPADAIAAGYNANNGFFTAVTEKYLYTSNAVMNGTSLGKWRENLSGAGNYVIGIVAGGDAPNQNSDGTYINSGSNNTNYTDKYTYLTDSVAAATTLGTGRNESAGAGTAFVGIFAGGANNSHVNLATSEKYTYANDTVAYGGTLQDARRWLSASSNPTVGIYAGGFVNAGRVYVDLYTFSDDSVAAGTNLSQEWFARTGTGNSTYALIGGGYKNGVVVNAIDRYYYTSATWATSSTLTITRNQFGAASDPTLAVFGPGIDTSQSANGYKGTDVYKYSDETVVAGTDLNTPRYCIAGLSTSPSGL